MRISCEMCGREVDEGHEIRVVLEDVIVLVCSPECRDAVLERSMLEEVGSSVDDRDRR